MKFTKMHGLGNNYIYIDLFVESLQEEELHSLAQRVSNVNTGIGSDGMILIGPSEVADFRMRIFNADGSEGKNCGNGLRCLAKYVYERNLTDQTIFTVETLGGMVRVEVHLGQEGGLGNSQESGLRDKNNVPNGRNEVLRDKNIASNGRNDDLRDKNNVPSGRNEVLSDKNNIPNGQNDVLQDRMIQLHLANSNLSNQGRKVHEVTVDMGEPHLHKSDIPMAGEPESTTIDEPIVIDGENYRLTAVSVGNPHAVLFVADVDAVPLHRIGPKIEQAALFPERINVEFIRVRSRTEIDFRVWERGSGITQACGTGACAAVAAGVLNGYLERNVPVTVHLAGGDLEIRWDDNSHIYMKGPAEFVADGEFHR